MLGNIEIEKKNNFTSKRLLFLSDVDIKKLLVSKKFFWWENYKYFIGYLYGNHKVQPLQIN